MSAQQKREREITPLASALWSSMPNGVNIGDMPEDIKQDYVAELRKLADMLEATPEKMTSILMVYSHHAGETIVVGQVMALSTATMAASFESIRPNGEEALREILTSHIKQA